MVMQGTENSLREVRILLWALMGAGYFYILPFYTGYYSKDILIHGSSYTYVFSDLFLHWISNIPILLTTLYSTKLIYLVFMKEGRANKSTFPKVGEGYSKLFVFPFIIAGIPIIGPSLIITPLLWYRG